MPEADSIRFRHPTLADGPALHALIAACPPLDVNTVYAYCLIAHHFGGTSIFAEEDGKLLGAVTGYHPPERPDTWFVWQVAVHADGRGRGLAGRMLRQLYNELQPKRIETTIGPDNDASRALFRSFAKKQGLNVTIHDFLAADVCGPGHDAEDLFVIAPEPTTGDPT
ncbi:MAG: diaminobutyrate acetyltransferase [Planctomycetota bacterium]